MPTNPALERRSTKLGASTRYCLLFLSALLLLPLPVFPDGTPDPPLKVLHAEGLTHGFLLMYDEGGALIAEGDQTEVAHGDRITSVLTFHFKDGSLQEETTVFSQRRIFRLLHYHLIQKGPSFKIPMDLSLEALTGKVAVHYTDQDGREKDATDQIKPLPELSNGLIPILLKNVPPGDVHLTISMVIATPKPRVIKLAISTAGEESCSVGSFTYKAINYDAKIDLGGVAGVVAPFIGKQPPDIHVWILKADAPVFLKFEGPQFAGGPNWRIEFASPSWPK